MKVYSKIDSIKLRQASTNIVDGVLALQGGAFRGVYTSGVLDCLMDNDINIRDCVGISAGALNGVNYISGDIGRSAKINLEYRHNSNWVGYKALREDKGIVGFSFIFNKITDKLPFNANRFFSEDRTLYALITNLETGEQECITNHQKELIFTAVKASASMPYISSPVELNGSLYLDGGCKYISPLRFAKTLGKKIVYIATRDRNFRENVESSAIFKRGTRAIYKKYPKFIEDLENANAIHNDDLDELDKLEDEGTIFRITPSKQINIAKFEGDMEKLGALYHLGYNDAKKKIPALKKFLGMDNINLVKGGIYHYIDDIYYQIEDYALDTENKEEVILYRSLDDKKLYSIKKNLFIAKNDKKITNIDQEYLFELITDEKILKNLEKYIDK